jgi:hypothetical protein
MLVPFDTCDIHTSVTPPTPRWSSTFHAIAERAQLHMESSTRNRNCMHLADLFGQLVPDLPEAKQGVDDAGVPGMA